MDKRFTKLDGVCRTLSADLRGHVLMTRAKAPRMRFTSDVSDRLPDIIDIGYHYSNGIATVAISAGTSLKVNRTDQMRNFIQAARLIRAIETNNNCTLELGEWVPVTWDGDTMLVEFRTTEAPPATPVVEVTR